MSPIVPDHEHVSWFMRIWIEIKNTPTEVVIGFIAMMTAGLKLLGKSVKQDVIMSPKVTRDEMNDCKDEMLGHVDTKFEGLEERIDDLYKLIAEKGA